MKNLEDIFPKNLYHSYVIEGNPDYDATSLHSFLIERGDIEAASPDTHLGVYDSFTISDSSQIKTWYNEQKIGELKRVCIIAAKFINHDAEQTLLKIIEEPKVNTHFFLIVPNADVLLDTILSRVHVVKINNQKTNNDSIIQKETAKTFFTSKTKERLVIVESIIKAHKNDPNSGGVRYSAIELISGVEEIVYELWKKDKPHSNLELSLLELKKSREFLAAPGASVKMILEHISLVV